MFVALEVFHCGHLKMCLLIKNLVIAQTTPMPKRPLSILFSALFSTLEFSSVAQFSSFYRNYLFLPVIPFLFNIIISFSFYLVLSKYLNHFLPFFCFIIFSVFLFSILISSTLKHMLCCVILYLT